jgi:hypothetical protein
MAVMAREVWTDERLDDLNKKVDEGFREMREEFRAIRTEMSAQNRMMVQLFGGMFATFVIGTLGTIATIITTA